MKDLKEIIKNSVEMLLREKVSLLELEAHEQAITHRIAFYLEYLLSKNINYKNLNIDCEYNKHGDQPKTIDLRGEPKDYCDCKFCKNITIKKPEDEKYFRPDIIVHKRKTDNHNAIVIELKKSNICYFDLEKLKILTRDKGEGGYGYRIGVFIYFLDEKPIYKWFSKGKEI